MYNVKTGRDAVIYRYNVIMCLTYDGRRQPGVVNQIWSGVVVIVVGGRVKAHADQPRRRTSGARRAGQSTAVLRPLTAVLSQGQPLCWRLFDVHQLRAGPPTTAGRRRRRPAASWGRRGDGSGRRRNEAVGSAEGWPAVLRDAGR